MARLESTILKSLIKNEDYARKVLPFIKAEYFQDQSDKAVYEQIADFYAKYNAAPTNDALAISIAANKTLSQNITDGSQTLIKEFDDSPIPTEAWLIDNTEKFCQEKALHIAMYEAIDILEGKGKKAKGAIPELLTNALAVTFDPKVGHDYIEDANERYAYYHKVENKLRFSIDIYNKVTNGGVAPKTLNMLMGGIHVGKTAALCDLATGYLLNGYNVLYITKEMSEEEIARRIDANILNTPMDDVANLPKQVFENRIAQVNQKIGKGKLKIREFPTGSASVLHFRALVNELYLKKNFKPDVIIIDYINICASSRIKMGGSINSYTYIKSIAEEIRGLAKELELPIWSATQLNREGMKSSDPQMTDTSESLGLPATVDLLWILSRSEQLDNLGQICFTQAKNRYRDISKDTKFVVGFDRPKMRFFDVSASAQANVQQPTVNLNANNNPFSTKPKIGPTDTSSWKIT